MVFRVSIDGTFVVVVVITFHFVWLLCSTCELVGSLRQVLFNDVCVSHLKLSHINSATCVAGVIVVRLAPFHLIVFVTPIQHNFCLVLRRLYSCASWASVRWCECCL